MLEVTRIRSLPDLDDLPGGVNESSRTLAGLSRCCARVGGISTLAEITSVSSVGVPSLGVPSAVVTAEGLLADALGPVLLTAATPVSMIAFRRSSELRDVRSCSVCLFVNAPRFRTDWCSAESEFRSPFEVRSASAAD